MELSSFQRFISFTATVIVLVGLGVYLFLPSASGASGRTGPGSGQHGHGHSAPPGTPGANPSTAAGTPGPVQSGPAQAPDIYQWLPFTRAGLASAASVAVRFGDDYGTYSYAESTASYLAPMRPLVTAGLAQLLGRAYATPGVAAARVSGKQASTASTAILSLRGFGPTSLTFVASISERITDSGGSRLQTSEYAITVSGSGTAWQVSDIEAASAGNQ